MSNQGIHGATTVGLVCSDGVLLASEKRVSWGRLVVSRKAKKVFKLTDEIGLAFAGFISDMQALSREASAYANLYELEHDRPISVKAMAKLISNMLFQHRIVPYIMQTIVGGIGEEGKALYSLDPLGSLIPDNFVSSGSGAPIAMGVLEAEYEEDMSLKEGKELALKAIKAGVARDTMSGDGVDMLLISEEGIKEESHPIK